MSKSQGVRPTAIMILPGTDSRQRSKNGNLGGEISVGRKTEDRVKLDYLAKVIAKVIKEGRY